MDLCNDYFQLNLKCCPQLTYKPGRVQSDVWRSWWEILYILVHVHALHSVFDNNTVDVSWIIHCIHRDECGLVLPCLNANSLFAPFCFLCHALLSLSFAILASLFLSLTAFFIAVNPAINIVGLLNMRLVFCLCLDIMHCFKSKRESLLGIKSKLRHWELSYWEWPCRRGCLRAEQFPWIFHCQPSGCCVARTRGVPGVKGKWIPTYPASERVWYCTQCAFWINSSRHIVSPTAGRVSGHGGHCFPSLLIPVLTSLRSGSLLTVPVWMLL